MTVALAIAFCLFMGFVVRPLLGRVSTAYDEAGRVPSGWIAAIFAGVLLSAYTTETIGIALIFGAFVMGMIMPRHAELTEDVTHRIEDFVVTLLLPLFFAFTGLRTNIGLLDRPELWLLTVVLIAVAIVGKLVGALLAARLTGFDWRAVGGDRDADEHARAHRADRAQPGARDGRDLRGPVRDARADGARHDLHGRPAAQPARPQQQVRRAGRGGARGGPRASRRRSSPSCRCPSASILVAPQSRERPGALLAPGASRWRAPSRRAS